MRAFILLAGLLLLTLAVAGCHTSEDPPAPTALSTASGVPATQPAVSPSATVSPGATATAAPTGPATPQADSTPEPAPSEPAPVPTVSAPSVQRVSTGLDLLVASDFEGLAGRRVGLIANQVSTSGGRHAIDWFHEHPEVELVAVFAPEHGVRGTAGAGEDVGDTTDPATGVPIYSLYTPGSDFRPSPDELAGIDVLVHDLQDVGTRFYTYISTMGRAMEAAAQAGIDVVVLDRPNPSGGARVSGFTRTDDQVSFISEYPIPSLYGLTAGELARMIVGEGWKAVEGLELTVLPVGGWARTDTWLDIDLPWVPPSPGLQTAEAAMIYPGTVLVEATTLSFGRGTLEAFTVVGAPWVEPDEVVEVLQARGQPGVSFAATTFTPQVIPDVAEDPEAIQFLGQQVPAVAITITDPQAFDPVAVGVHLIEVFRAHAAQQGQGELIDRPSTFDLLAGTGEVRRQLQAGVPAAQIVQSWADDVEAFRQARAPYLLY